MPTPAGIDRPEKGRPDFEADRQRVTEVLERGGIAIIPTHSGYGLVGNTLEAVERIIRGKGRGTHKRIGLITDSPTEREIHVLDSRSRDIVDCITQDYDLPLSVLGRYDPDHRLLKDLDPQLLKMSTALGRIAIPVNTAPGPFHDSVARVGKDTGRPVFGSSANLTGKGGKVRVDDIEPEITAIADVVLDYGLARYHHYGVAGTQINLETMEVTRFGACYELISDIVRRHFDWELPPDPGRAASPHGLVNEFPLAGLEA